MQAKGAQQKTRKQVVAQVDAAVANMSMETPLLMAVLCVTSGISSGDTINQLK